MRTIELSYCAGQVRAHDADRYLCTLFAPADAREALFALYAFDHEIARVRQVVSEPMPGLIRLQWWRDALDAIAAGRPPAHPVAQALCDAWLRLGGERERLDAAIDARERELEEEAPFPDPPAFDRHLEATSGGVALAALGMLGVRDQASRQAGREVGFAWGLAALLRALPRDAGQRRLLLPLAPESGARIDRERVFACLGDEALAATVRELVQDGRDRVARARRLRRRVARDAMPVLLLGTLAVEQFRRLERTAHDPFATAAAARSPLTPLRLLWRDVVGAF